jgi:hypothetical protein
MRLLLDANVLLDCLILESSGLPRVGKEASARILDLCDRGRINQIPADGDSL